MIFSRIDPGGQLVIGCRKAATNADVQVRHFRHCPISTSFSSLGFLILNYSKLERFTDLLQILFGNEQEPQQPPACDSPGEASFSGVNDTPTSVCSYLLFSHDVCFYKSRSLSDRDALMSQMM